MQPITARLSRSGAPAALGAWRLVKHRSPAYDVLAQARAGMKGTDRYRVKGVSCRIGERQLEIVNLSVGGFFVACAELPPLPGESLGLELVLTGGRGSVKITGVVAWLNERAAPRMPALPAGFGIRITRIGFAEKMALLAFLRDVDPAQLRRD